MSKADEMLSTLGFMHIGETDNDILWILYGHEYKYEIDFMKKKKEVAFREVERETDTIVSNCGITIQELQAINEKVKELRLGINNK